VRAFGLSRDRADEVAAEACAEVWRTFNLARGGAAFEGFVQGRFVEALRRKTSPPARTSEDRTGATPAPPDDISGTRLQAQLDELRARNPRHHQAVELLYVDKATPTEAADALAVDVWTLGCLVARARLALAQGLERAEQRRQPGPARRTGPKPRRPGRRP
jgi:DNA-directed RNA polymerase specialized sigma24 family protein